MADKHRWLLAELRARSFDASKAYKDGEGVTIVVNPERGTVFDACWFQGRWYLGACAGTGMTYLLPEDGDVVAACIDWAAGWDAAPPATVGMGAAAPPEVVERHGLKPLSRAEVSAWLDAIFQWAKRRAF